MASHLKGITKSSMTDQMRKALCEYKRDHPTKRFGGHTRHGNEAGFHKGKKLNQFSKNDVFNLDETGLFYRLQADHSLATKQLEGRKQDKERLTIAICCNEDGSEKIPLWVIGKYAKPRCFKSINMSSIDCQYRANKRAWMTSVLFL
ncbi:hypothetical protein GQ457_08G036670 [Hibiscus cannabinus]